MATEKLKWIGKYHLTTCPEGGDKEYLCPSLMMVSQVQHQAWKITRKEGWSSLFMKSWSRTEGKGMRQMHN